MGTSLQTNSSNDIFLDGYGNIATCTGQLAVLQDCEHAVKALAGEMIFQQDEGMPYFQEVWAGGVANLAQFQAALKKTLLNVPFVIKVFNISVQLVSSSLEYSCDIESAYGKLALNSAYGLITSNTQNNQ